MFKMSETDYFSTSIHSIIYNSLMILHHIIHVYTDCKTPIATHLFSDHLRQFKVLVFIISCYNFYNETKIRN